VTHWKNPLRQRIEGAMRAGASLDQVEAQIIGPSDLDEGEEAALWLYAHACQEGRGRYAAGQASLRRGRGRAAGTD
jgi:hypothetical protein